MRPSSFVARNARDVLYGSGTADAQHSILSSPITSKGSRSSPASGASDRPLYITRHLPATGTFLDVGRERGAHLFQIARALPGARIEALRRILCRGHVGA